MFFPESRIRVFLWGQPTDMRQSFDGLYTLARSGFAVDPLQGHLYHRFDFLIGLEERLARLRREETAEH